MTQNCDALSATTLDFGEHRAADRRPHRHRDGDLLDAGGGVSTQAPRGCRPRTRRSPARRARRTRSPARRCRRRAACRSAPASRRSGSTGAATSALPPTASPLPPNVVAGKDDGVAGDVAVGERQQLFHLVLRVLGGAGREMPLVLGVHRRERPTSTSGRPARPAGSPDAIVFRSASCRPRRRAAESAREPGRHWQRPCRRRRRRRVRHVRTMPVADTVTPNTAVPSVT